jgi:hypothetical protein
LKHGSFGTDPLGQGDAVLDSFIGQLSVVACPRFEPIAECCFVFILAAKRLFDLMSQKLRGVR